MILYAFTLLSGSKEPKEWIELAGTGEWKGYPTRNKKGFSLTEKDLNDMVANFKRDRRGRLVVDYEHQTLLTEKNGKPAPAAGWITALEVRQVEGGPKLMGRVDWTRSATTAIESNEYAYISPVIIFEAKDRVTGKPIGTLLHSVALTNHPFLDDLAAVAATMETPSMNPLLLLLLPFLALSQTATEEDVVQSVERLSKGRKAVCKGLGLAKDASDDVVEAAMNKAATPLRLGQAAMASLKLTDATTPEQAEAALKPVIEHAGWISATDHNAVVAELGKLKSDSLVREAIAEGKIVPAQEPWARGFAASDPEGFKAWSHLAPKIVSPADTDRKGPPKTVTLTDIERDAARQLGLTDEQYLKAKENN